MARDGLLPATTLRPTPHDARMTRVSVVRYSFTVRDSYPLLLAGLPAHIGFVLLYCYLLNARRFSASDARWGPATDRVILFV